MADFTPTHGTYRGYQWHRRHNVPIPKDDPCGCRAARAAWERDRRAGEELAVARDRAKLSVSERDQLATFLLSATDEGPIEAYVEDLITDRLRRYSTV